MPGTGERRSRVQVSAGQLVIRPRVMTAMPTASVKWACGSYTHYVLTSGGTWSPSFTPGGGYSLDAYLWPVPETEARFLGCPTCSVVTIPTELHQVKLCALLSLCASHLGVDCLVRQRPITIYCQVVWSTFASVALTDLHVSSDHSALKCTLPDRGILPAAVTFD